MAHLHKQQNLCYVTLFVALTIIYASKAVEVNFHQNYKVVWGNHHVFFLQNGREVQLSIDKTSGAGFGSKLNYASGFFQMRIKIPNKDSRGVVTAFYLTSTAYEHIGAKHDEIDFEFLGNNGKPYTLQTNVFANDEGGREQRHSLWFDPSIDFHIYGVLWNQHQIVFYVDGIPIRVFKNNSKVGVSFPSQQMRVTASIWNGEPWASNGKRIDWKQAPFTAHFQGFNIHGCQTLNRNKHVCYSPHLWWNDHKHWQLNPQQQKAYEDVRKKHLLYDYCSDRGELHKECQIN
ncbi:xyloglucan endotransglucosylase/hydrolase protein 2 [Cajanus cajan]|uniref:Xyloglucan endotransglucosylase/hydrolase n=1 Tax=Cajanus cajan TaxID=3821 RepID=A0A151T8S7_CAJCA|nr:xyloglucan endotransglucosylase/hydrolase protein 2 [Cajanus cajan]KYP63447.1 Xyloglucan endotransglucosylase/hydrolase protein 2 [Cajanus cajan]